MNTSDFDYRLPPERIAQEPAPQREDARLLVAWRACGTWTHAQVRDLPEFLQAGDLLVLNDTRVLPARVTGRKEPSGGRVELLFLEEATPGEWLALCRASRPPAVGSWIRLGAGGARAEVLGREGRGELRLRVDSSQPVLDFLEKEGAPPLPPYIRRRYDGPDRARLARDRERYQTVFARRPGAVAAPTAGLHFSESLLAALERRGVRRTAITLHVGAGTFRPVTSERIEDHRMEAERYEVSAEAAQEIETARAERRRVVAVGTTVVRALETVALARGRIEACAGRTELFIYPPFAFRVVDALLTNFHLPRSTLLMLVCAFAGREFVLRLYEEAIRQRYRFYSFGDAMLLL